MELGARSFDEHRLHLQTKQKENYGYQKEMIFMNLIEYKNYQIEAFYLFLRISDHLFNLLIQNFLEDDEFEKNRYEIKSCRRLNSFNEYLSKSCKIKLSFKLIKLKNKLAYRDLKADEKIRLFENLESTDNGWIVEEKYLKIKKLWVSFYLLLKTNDKRDHINLDFNLMVKKWLDLFLSIYDTSLITPYIHVFVSHLHQFKNFSLSFFKKETTECNFIEQKDFEIGNIKAFIKSSLLKINLINEIKNKIDI